MYKLPLAAFWYGITFHYAYIADINRLFDYAGYSYSAPTLLTLSATYVFIVMPVVAYRPSLAPSSMGAALIFAICYVPAQLIILFTWQRLTGELLLLQLLIAASMTIILRSSVLGETTSSTTQVLASRLLSLVVRVLTILALAVFIFIYKDSIQLVGFDDVYDLRFETNKVDQGAFVNYLTSWLIYCFIPFYFARGIAQNNRNDIALGFAGSVLIYVTMASKASILLGLIMYALSRLMRTGVDYLFTLLIILSTAVLFAVIILPDDGVLFYGKSILLVRTLSAGGWAMANYYDFFSTHGFTFYTHIRFVDALFNAYPYGDYSLGQLIGFEYTGGTEANFNANFWASDAFAALGLAGVPVVTAAICGALYLINKSAYGYPRDFVVLWFAGFWLALLNVPLSVALLSGGGFLTMLLLWLDSPKVNQLFRRFSGKKKIG